MITKLIRKPPWFKVWSAITAIALIIALALTFLPYQVDIDTGGLLSISLGPSQAQANPGWLTGWDYRKDVTVYNASADYQTRLTVYYGSGSDGNNTVYCDSHCNADFSDLRFAGADETTLLDYWVESYTASTNATVWVQNDATPSTTCYMYYGNSEATSASNITNTFIKGDDFEWGDDEDPLSDDGGGIDWTISAPGTCKVEIDTDQYYLSTRSARIYKVGTDIPYAYFSKSALASTEAIDFRFRKDETSQLRLYHGNGSYRIFTYVGYDEHIYYDDGSAHDTGATVSVETWYLLSIRNANWASHTYDIYLDGNLIQASAVMRELTGAAGAIMFYGYAGADSEYWLDNVLVRKYVSPEPTWGSWGEEISPEIPTAIAQAATYVTCTAARINGEITDDGYEPCEARFRWRKTDQSFFPLDPVEVTPETSEAWVDVDVSAYVPSGATGVLLHWIGASAHIGPMGVRKNGSTDTGRIHNVGLDNGWAAIGVDANRVFEAYCFYADYQHIYLIGYTTSGVTFFTNTYNKSLGVTDSWQDIDCSVEAPNAIGLIFEVIETGGGTYLSAGLRKNGSSDNRTAAIWGGTVHSVIIGCDDSQVCEGYISSTNVKFYLIGYITSGAVFNTNATDLSLGTTGSWQDLAALPSGAAMGFIEINNTADSDALYGLRENGSSEDIYGYACRHHWGFVGCDENELIEGKIHQTVIDFYLVGYATGWATTDWQNSLVTDSLYHEDLTELEPDTECEFQTQAKNSAGESDWSESAYFTTCGISNTPTTNDFGILQVSATSNTVIDYFAITNTGNCAVDITIQGTNLTGGDDTWVLSGTATPGENIYGLYAGLDDDDDTFDVVVNATANAFVSGLAESATQDWGLKIYMPTALSGYDNNEMSGTITLVASAAA